MAAIEIRDLRVDYGDFVAVNDISLEIPEGEVFGLVGPNGAGKTSTFRVLASLMEPTYGEVRICGIDLFESTEEARTILGYMPDLAPVPSDLKAWEFLDFHADTHSLGNRATRKKRLDACLEQVAMTAKRDAWCKELSRGQTQRLVLAKTLLHKPRVLILDEPASGLDPLSRRELRQTVQKLAAEGMTVLVSSHILSELDEMCSLLCVMNQGTILASGTSEEVRDQLGSNDRALSIRVVSEPEKAITWLEAHPDIQQVAETDGAISFQFHGDAAGQAALLGEMIGAGVAVRTCEERRSSFEEILVKVAEANRKGGAA